MIRDNLSTIGMVKTLMCEMCKEFESFKHLMFEHIVSRLQWDDVQVFGISVSNFESIASKWLCNKRFLHFNLVSSTTLWGLWINRNNRIFNKVTWINIKHVWRQVLSFQKD
jgi:hypothetical protein